MSVVENFEPKALWNFFDELRKIPRPSGREEAVADYVVSVAKTLGLEHKRDKEGNVLIVKPASAGLENSPVVVLQSHLDMVCEKNSDKEFDFDKDAIELVVDGEWLKADGTTLGADNGIGVATALAVLSDNSLKHGPIEALFTVDEERGLVGAKSVSPDWLKGRIMLNLDSEDLGLFSIGCAGGEDSNIELSLALERATENAALTIHLSGLRGGHSGVDIHEGRGNALKILNRLFYQANKDIPLRIASFTGGDKHNAIPREAFVQVVLSAENVPALKAWINKAIEDIRVEFAPVEKDIAIQILENDDIPSNALTADSQNKLLALLFALPHGPLAMSRTIKDLVETSNNVAAVKFDGDKVKILCSARSSNKAALRATQDKLAAITDLAGGSIQQPNGYPGWMPNLDSEILQISLDTFKAVANRDAEYEAIHAGLECGLIGEKFSGMDMISIGPTIKHPHSPDERVHVKSVDVYYRHTLAILEKVAV